MSVLTLPKSGTPAPWGRAKAFVFEDPRSSALLSRIRQIAPSDATVLVVGETGTGKEIVARHIHDISGRGGRPFVAVNCGAFAPALIESDLFGHERGAFTGAFASRPGVFEQADGGTLFLDEIGDLPLAAQVKLLRVLQEHEVVRLGSQQRLPVDVRLIVATNVNLEAAVGAGRFREDLYYRLAVVKVAISPLRERPGDILPLARYFLGAYAGRLGRHNRGAAPELSGAAETRLLAHPWPGNIRELENAIHHALLVCHEGRILPEDLPLLALPHRAVANETSIEAGEAGAEIGPLFPPFAIAPATTTDPRELLRAALRSLFQEAPPRLWDQIEEIVVGAAYEHSSENQLRTARLLGVSRNVLRGRLMQIGRLVRPARAGQPRAPVQPRPRINDG